MGTTATQTRLKAGTIRTANKICDEFTRLKLPGHMWDGVERYLTRGIIPGDFLVAVFESNLAGAAHHADHYNQSLLYVWACFMFNAMPTACWGNPDKVQAWKKRGGLSRSPK